MPKTAAITNIRNLLPTLMSKNLYAASVPAKAREGADHGAGDDAVTELRVEELAQRAERDALEGAKASTRPGLMTRLNEFTIESAKAPRLPIITRE